MPGFLDFNDPMTQMAVGLLGSGQGTYGAFGPGLGQGLLMANQLQQQNSQRDLYRQQLQLQNQRLQQQQAQAAQQQATLEKMQNMAKPQIEAWKKSGDPRAAPAEIAVAGGDWQTYQELANPGGSDPTALIENYNFLQGLGYQPQEILQRLAPLPKTSAAPKPEGLLFMDKTSGQTIQGAHIPGMGTVVRVPQEVEGRMVLEETLLGMPGTENLTPIRPGQAQFTGSEMAQGIKPTTSMSTEAQKSVVGAGLLKSALQEVKRNYDPSKQGMWKDIGAKLQGMISRVIPTAFQPEPGETNLASSQRAWKQSLGQIEDLYRLEITASQAGMKELDRLRENFINRDIPPAEFPGALEQAMLRVERVERAYQNVLNQGIQKGDPRLGPALDAELARLPQSRTGMDVLRYEELKAQYGDDDMVYKIMAKEGSL